MASFDVFSTKLLIYQNRLVVVMVAVFAFCCGSSTDEQTPVESASSFTKGDDAWWRIGGNGDGVNSIGGEIKRMAARDFWPGTVVSNPDGFLTTSDGVAIRVLASSRLVPLFDTSNTAFPGGVVDIMKPFRAYRVIRKENDALLIAEPPFAQHSPQYWVRRDDCYVWATGKGAEINGYLRVYKNEDLARSREDPLAPTAKYTSIRTLPNTLEGRRVPPLSKLPLLSREQELTIFLCPANGGILCWVNMSEANDSIAISNL